MCRDRGAAGPDDTPSVKTLDPKKVALDIRQLGESCSGQTNEDHLDTDEQVVATPD